MEMRRMSWRRFIALVAGLSSDSRFIRAWSEDRKRAGPLANADADDPNAYRGMF